MNLIRPIPQNCPSCNTLTYPKLSKTESKTQVVTEAKYFCGNCSAYFRRSPVECIEKQVISEK